MKPSDLLERLSVHGVRLRANGGKLTVTARRGVVSPARLAFVREHRDALLSVVAQADAVLADLLQQIARLEAQRPGWVAPAVLRELVQRYHRENDPLLFVAGDTVRRLAMTETCKESIP